jgi:hypothetical protein
MGWKTVTSAVLLGLLTVGHALFPQIVTDETVATLTPLLIGGGLFGIRSALAKNGGGS